MFKIQDSLFRGQAEPFFLIAGPCVIESGDHAMRMAESLTKLTAELGIRYIFKSSFDKANRAAVDAYRGPGIDQGLDILAKVRASFEVPVLTDIHEPWQAEQAAASVDILQIPALLCRQTDLVLAAARTGTPINIKKGQFMSAFEIEGVVRKAESVGNRFLLLTERGSSFGYNNLVVDFRSLPIMQRLGYPLVFDATHSIQLPGAKGHVSSGNPEYAYDLARAAIGVGVAGLFIEVHDNPDRALSDRSNMVRLDSLGESLRRLRDIDAVVKGLL